jgi:hypothetical protein
MAKRAVTTADILDGHVSLDLQCLDRIYLNGYLPNLQLGGQMVQFLALRGFPIPSSTGSVTGSGGRCDLPSSSMHLHTTRRTNERPNHTTPGLARRDARRTQRQVGPASSIRGQTRACQS